MATRTGMQSELELENSVSGSVEAADGARLAEMLVRRLETRDVFEIAADAGLRIVYQKWFPVTLGEFDWTTQTICVNENAPVEAEKIIAHELGHFFVRKLEIKNIADEEHFCDRFAARLLR